MDTQADYVWQLGCESVACDGCRDCGVEALVIIERGCGHRPEAVRPGARVTPAVFAALGRRVCAQLRALGGITVRSTTARTGTRIVARGRGDEDIVWIHMRVDYSGDDEIAETAIATVLADPRWRIAGHFLGRWIDLLFIDNLCPRVRL